MSIPKAKLLVNFNGEFTTNPHNSTVVYVGGKTRLVLVDPSVNFDSLMSKISQICNSSSTDSIELKFQLPNETLNSRLVSIECDDDVFAMFNEFDRPQRIPIYVLRVIKQSSTRRGSICPTGVEMVVDEPISNDGENGSAVNLQELGGGEVHAVAFPRVDDAMPLDSVDSLTSPASCALVCGGDNQNLAVGQEFPDAQGFRNALRAAAIAMKFELRMIRSDRTRVTATCAADGCPWRIHASKLPEVQTFQIKTMKEKHTCSRPERTTHRQATMKWIISCIKDRVQDNIDYRPKDIMRDLENEYGVTIPYLRAHRAKERALELIYGMPIKDIICRKTEAVCMENVIDDTADLQKKKLLKGNPAHCNICKKIGHNRRSCVKLRQKESQIVSSKEKNFHCMLCKQSGHNRRTCQRKVCS
ncbi:Transposase, MuDR, plant [Dillenia turbinata]|uniref:Transposase, MuDR, plant n=1 Tax=Dillenia turbinata TaxID=194707 RepID=A0AAN8Z542_9MAGN